VVGECGDGLSAVEAIGRLEPDLVLLDVQMPGLDGFEVLELLDRAPAIVFVTAYDEYAVKAFEVGAVDYLLKPFPRQRLTEAVARAAARRAAGLGQPLAELAAAARRGRRPLSRLLVREQGRVHVLPAERIDYVEAQGDYVRFRLGERYLSKQETLGELEALLDPARFVRIHRSYLLNVERLSRLELYAKDSRVAVLADGTRLPVSRAGYARLRERVLPGGSPPSR
jgi:two-component system LytT family response regulator